MKVIQINTTQKNGSTGRIAFGLNQYLLEKYENGSIVYGYGDVSDANSFSLNHSWGNHLHSFLSRKLCMQGRVSVLATIRAIHYLKRQKPDIIHLHNIHGHYLNYPLLFRYLRNTNIPIVWTFHDCWPFTGKCAHYTSSKCMKWKTECCNCPNLKSYPDSNFDASRYNFRLKKKYFTALNNLHIVTVSNWLCNQVQESFFKDKDIIKIYNGINTEIFYPRVNDLDYRKNLGISDDTFVILGVSNVWKEDKGLTVFYSLDSKLDNGCQIILVGLNDQQLENLPSDIIGLKRTENINELAKLYSVCDVLLNPSREETFGLVPIEANACGVPVIVSDQTACPESVNNGLTGLIVDMTNMNAIIHAIKEIRQNGKAFYKDNCVLHVKNNFSQRLMYENYYELYLKVKRETT